MLTLELGPSPQIVCIGAHCDDIEIGCGGTLTTLARAWPDAHFHCWVFSGDAERARESQECLNLLLGSKRFSLQVFGHRDGYFPAEWPQIKQCLSDLSRSVRAGLVFTHTSTDLHQDHRILAELTWNHFRAHTILEYEIVKFDGDLGRTNFYVPLTNEQLAAKVEALLTAFASQAGKAWFTRTTFEGIARLRGVESNSPSGFAEAFHARKSVLAVRQPSGAAVG